MLIKSYYALEAACKIMNKNWRCVLNSQGLEDKKY